MIKNAKEVIRELKMEMTIRDLPVPNKLNIVPDLPTMLTRREEKTSIKPGFFNRLFRRTITSWIEKSVVNRENEKNEMLYSKMKELSKHGVITGSAVLKLYGMLDRNVSDIDVIVDEEACEYLKSKHVELSYGHYSDISDEKDIELLCSLDYSPSYKIDLFPLNPDMEIIEYDGLRLQHPYSVIQNKIKIFNQSGRGKDFQDFCQILKCWNDGVYVG